jgi:hypothetical protein
MSQAKSVKEVLIATEWILTHLEWVQFNYLLNDKNQNVNSRSVKSGKQVAKSCCLAGAMWLVETDWQLYEQARQHLADIAKEHVISFNKEYLISFNDKFGRTKEEVLELVRKGIESAP